MANQTQPINQVPAQKKEEAQILHVKIRNREKVLYDAAAKAISSYNDKGNFDILGRHANFISLIKNFLTVYKPDGSKEEIKIDNGLLQVVHNEVLIFIGIVNLSFLSQEISASLPQKNVYQAPLPPAQTTPKVSV